MRKLLGKYVDTFKGLSHEIWLLSAVTLVNRAGMMVIPFLSIYLTKEIGLSLDHVGWIMTCYGLGSIVGAWSGGKLTDKFGGYRVMFVSFILGGIGFILLQFLQSFQSLCIGIFLLTLVADAFRPALFVAMSNYSKAENRTRSVTLIRLAINLGMAMGPSVGGLLIVGWGYAALFWVDGLTNIMAAILLILLLNPKKRKAIEPPMEIDSPLSPYRDTMYLFFLAGLMVFTLAFLQYFSTMPVYYRSVYALSEGQIGFLMAGNGFLIFLIEMPIVQYFENRKTNKISLIMFGLILLALSFIILPLFTWVGILILAMFLMTIGEILVFPFANAVAVNKSKKGKQGEYMALFSMNFSFAHIIGHNAGLQSVNYFGYNTTWFAFGFLVLIGFGVFRYVNKKDKIVSE